MNAPPLASIVMPSFNQAQFIAESIKSVFRQDYAHIELIISDGGSNDGTVDLLEALSDQYPRMRWWSEPDDGPAHALNKALKAARGTIIGWLNSDDLYEPGAISAATEAFRKDANLIMVYGKGRHIDANGVEISPYPTRTPDAGLQGFLHGCYICQPTAFFKRSMVTLLGPLDQSLKTTFDYDYWLRAFAAFPDRIGHIDQLFASSRLHDACITMRRRRDVALEGVALCARYLGCSAPHWLTTYFEEIHSLPAEERGFDDLASHCLKTLELASKHLDAHDLDRIRAKFS